MTWITIRPIKGMQIPRGAQFRHPGEDWVPVTDGSEWGDADFPMEWRMLTVPHEITATFTDCWWMAFE